MNIEIFGNYNNKRKSIMEVELYYFDRFANIYRDFKIFSQRNVVHFGKYHRIHFALNEEKIMITKIPAKPFLCGFIAMASISKPITATQLNALHKTMGAKFNPDTGIFE